MNLKTTVYGLFLRFLKAERQKLKKETNYYQDKIKSVKVLQGIAMIFQTEHFEKVKNIKFESLPTEIWMKISNSKINNIIKST